MTHVFNILGYGIPADIFTDENYRLYLSVVFNRIFSTMQGHPDDHAVIVFSGGPTDMLPPYERTEAAEMRKFFSSLMDRPGVKEQTQDWKLVNEDRSLSTLENLISIRDLFLEQKLPDAKLYMFCEETRQHRVAKLAEVVFDDQDVRILAIDFDLSQNRYLDPEFIKEKEEKTLAFDLWSLKNEDNLAKHHEVYVEKLALLREQGPERHGDAIREWWEQKLKEFDGFSEQ